MRWGFARLCVALSCAMLPAATVAAPEVTHPRDFRVGDMQKIVARHAEGALIVNFWSLDCPYCMEELALLKQLSEKRKDWRLVLVSADGPEHGAAAAAALRQLGYEPGTTWIFADAHAQRLRYDIDRKWYGELPRTYFFVAGKQVAAVSGKLDAAKIEQVFASVPARK